MTLPQYRAAEDLERHLGDPFDDGNPFSHQRAVALDEREEFPQPAIAMLHEWGYSRYLVPAALGGKLTSFEEAAALQRAVSRRDLTAAIALGQSFLGAAAVWLAGTPEQQGRVAETLLGGGLCGLALTEEEHGSDLLASDVAAARSGGAWKLTGRKWLINNGTRGDAWTVFARTDPAGGLNGFTLFLVERPVASLPKKRTHGIRGADISGLVLDGTPATPVGPIGSGMDLALKSLQLTRTGCAQFALGAADTALRTALDFALDRKLYGARAFDIPHAQAVLTGAFLDLSICDALALFATRALQAAPGQMSLWSAVCKYFVPTTAERAIRDVAVVLGARHYLREGSHAIFQKMLRDSAVVSLFDGSTAVNLDAVAVQLQRLSTKRAASSEERENALRAICTLTEPLPALDAARFELMNAGRDDLTQGIAAARLRESIDENEALVAQLSREKRSSESFELARRHCVLSAAAACVHLFDRSRDVLDPFFGSEQGLAACLDRLLGGPARLPAEATAAMLRIHREDKAFSVVPVQLARR
ncbi:MAG: acyl-CoA dehydrogenase family protein [Myxococcales bacterium]